jgi:hypothetical protein
MMWLLQALNLRDRDDVFTIYIGDDTTDEDAFEVTVPPPLPLLHSPCADPCPPLVLTLPACSGAAGVLGAHHAGRGHRGDG